MIEKLYQSTEKLSGSEARNLLVNMMIKINIMRDSKDLQEEMYGRVIFFILMKFLESQKTKWK